MGKTVKNGLKAIIIVLIALGLPVVFSQNNAEIRSSEIKQININLDEVIEMPILQEFARNSAIITDRDSFDSTQKEINYAMLLSQNRYYVYSEIG